LEEPNAIRARSINNAIVNTYNFSKVNKIIDSGGGKAPNVCKTGTVSK
jgi:hypothetical protein